MAFLLGCAPRFLWLGRFLGRFFLRFHPLGMKHARLVDPFVGMRAKEVALSLKQIRRQTLGTIAVEISERRAEGRDGHAVFNRSGDRYPPIILGAFDDPGEVLIE